MGNQPFNHMKTTTRKARYQSLDYSAIENNNISKRYTKPDQKNRVNGSFATPPIQKSPYLKKRTENDQDRQPNHYEVPKGLHAQSKKKQNVFDDSGYQDEQEFNPSNKDRILEALSKQNEKLRKQLKMISDDLTEKLKKKKLIPKKKEEQLEQPENVKTSLEQKKNKEKLEQAYTVIEMYKRKISDYKSKLEGLQADHRVRALENKIASLDMEIGKNEKKVEGLNNVIIGQETQIQNDLHQQKKLGIQSYKKQTQFLKNQLRQFANRDRERETDYKRQQAYLCDLEKKVRSINGSYFPELNSSIKRQQPKTASSEVNAKQFTQAYEESKLLRVKHQDYHNRIETMLQLKSKRREEQRELKDQIIFKDRVIQALKNKIQTINKLLKPRRSGLFGIDSQQGTQMSSQLDEQQIKRRLEQELNQDQFDIKHLMANIPKPVRKKPQLIAVNEGGGRKDMKIANQKAQPKKWGVITTRTEKRGKHFKGQHVFEDKALFDAHTFPIIVGVNVWVNMNNTILGIQAIYMNKKQLKYGAKSSDQIIGGVAKRFDLQTPDYLKNVTMTVSKEGFVQSMTFSSKEGKIGKFGNKRSTDQNISFGLSSNQRPYLFFGASVINQEEEARLNFFGLEICGQ